ncbi:probable beta-D-xylosidase 7 [Tripterygium wilfordii]|uniref:probable beta-D-xylosidase 7 n=1 Tax=Tripterygium wilfordii TaxID=458696 RepID=UPI0018F84CB9|nr:probable beta-D-xylosidase 7 [Tripterygium wilfordii]
MRLLMLLCLFQLLHISTLFIAVESDAPPHACDPSRQSATYYSFCDKHKPIKKRVKNLVTHLTLDEKIAQLSASAPAIDRLGIPAYNWWSEALHGVTVNSYEQGIHLVGRILQVTSFPQVILTAASFDENLWYKIGQAIGIEARALYNAGEASGLTFWSPNINIVIDPRWGRAQETAGEDPLVASKYGVSFVRGIQGYSFEGEKLEDTLQASACCKHFTAYHLEKWGKVDRFTFNAIVSLQDLADTYNPPFKSCIQDGKASGLMCAYNRVNGVPNCADRDHLTNQVREQWGFDGYIVSDCDAVATMLTYANSTEEAVADAIKAGLDLDCGSTLSEYTKLAMDKNKLDQLQIDRAISNLFSVRMRLGLFDGDPTSHAYGNIGPEKVCSEMHQQLALDAAQDGIVLLKNSRQLLPFSQSKTTSLAVIGPNADNAHTLLGNYEGPPCISVTIFQALKGYIEDTEYHPGCNDVACASASIDIAEDLAKKADQVILVMGLDQSQESESIDREKLELPGEQRNLITQVAKAAKNPVVLVLVCGGPIDINFAKYDMNIGSILWAGYPGEAGGTALAKIIFGDHNPGGRLPMTWYPKDFISIPMTDMRMRPKPEKQYPGRTYRFYGGSKVFEFGYGLSYSKYSYKIHSVIPNRINLKQTSSKKMNEMTNGTSHVLVSELNHGSCRGFFIIIIVTNHGPLAGKHAVLPYIRFGKPRHGMPIKQLIGFQIVKLDPGRNSRVRFQFNLCELLGTANENGLPVVEGGTRILSVGKEEYTINITVD